MEQSVLDGASTIHLDELPRLEDDAGDWDAEIDLYWQNHLKMSVKTPANDNTIKPPSQNAGLMGGVRATELLDYKIQGGDGGVSAGVEDVIVDIESGEALYLVVGIPEGLLGSEKLIPIPLSVFGWDAD